MTPWMRRLHKWIGLLIAIQFVLWMASGLMMSWLEHGRVQGHTWRVHAVEAADWPSDALAIDALVAAEENPVTVVASSWLDGMAVYQLANRDGTRLLDARSGEPFVLDPQRVLRLAQASYSGPGQPATPRLVERTLETRAHDGAVWRVDFDDEDDTTVYLSADTGEVVVHRNKTWRLFDIFWMLHIMDYTGRSDFNNPLVVMSGIGGLWMALSGVWLLVASFRLSEFVPRRWRSGTVLAVFEPGGERLRSVPATSGENVYVALGRNGLNLPSNCGGGQSCGLCEVRVRGVAPPPTAADRAHLSESKLRMGFRLACNLSLQGEAEQSIEVAGGAALWDTQQATVEAVNALTPFLREIVLKPEVPVGAGYRPGTYVQVHVPAYEIDTSSIVVPETHRQAWGQLGLPARAASRDPVRRSYSLSLAPQADGGRLRLLVRFCPGAAGKRRVPPGKGSTWMYALKPGDRIAYSGPFGDFALKPGGAEKIFIGGGAGMGPLRAMVRARLSAGGSERIHFWYGARNANEVPFAEEMRQLVATHPGFTWQVVFSEPGGAEAGAMTGFVHQAVQAGLLSGHGAVADCEFYVCGPPMMLSATRDMLRGLGVADDRVAFDDFKI